jgi:hypothetical protein
MYDDKRAGKFPELYTDDVSALEHAAQAYDRPGMSVYQCVARLRPNARRRCLQTVASLDFLHVDIDLRALATERQTVLETLGQLGDVLPFEIRNSGGGFHVLVWLKEPVEAGTAEFDRANAARKALTEMLCGDPAPDHAAALLRRVGTHNTKYGEPRLCETLRDGSPVDLTDVEAFIDLHSNRPQFEWKPKVNGHDTAPGAVGGPVDIETELALMAPGEVNATQIRVIPALLRRAIHPNEVVDRVVAATMAMALSHPKTRDWTDAVEVKCVRARVNSALRNLLLRDYDPTVREIPPWLTPDWHQAWARILEEGRRPDIGLNAHGFYVRSAQGSSTRLEGNDTANADTANSAPVQPAAPPGRPAAPKPPAPRFKLLRYNELRPDLQHDDYLVDELLPRTGLYVVWGKFKCLKTFWVFDLMLHVAKGWEYRDRAVKQGLVVYCAFEGAHGFHKRAEAQRRHYKFDDDPPLRVMPAQLDLVADHPKFIAYIKQTLEADERPAVVVLDTLNRSLVGSESSDKDMAAYIAAAGAIREAFDCLVVILHHCGWNEARPRGHSSLPAAIDGQAAVTRDGDRCTVVVEFLRDGPEGAEIHSIVKSVVVGEDLNGKIRTSLVMLPSNTPARKDGGWPKSLAIFHRALRQSLKDHGGPFQETAFDIPKRAVALSVVRDEFYASYNPKDDTDPKKRQNAKRQAFNRSLDEAQERDLVKFREVEGREPMIWLTSQNTTYNDGEG